MGGLEGPGSSIAQLTRSRRPLACSDSCGMACAFRDGVLRGSHSGSDGVGRRVKVKCQTGFRHLHRLVIISDSLSGNKHFVVLTFLFDINFLCHYIVPNRLFFYHWRTIPLSSNKEQSQSRLVTFIRCLQQQHIAIANHLSTTPLASIDQSLIPDYSLIFPSPPALSLRVEPLFNPPATRIPTADSLVCLVRYT